MKRITALILAALLILAAVPALAEDPAPIVGVWYLDAEPTETNNTRIVYLYFISPDGGIYGMLMMFRNNALVSEATIGPRVFGSWSLGDDGEYRIYGWNDSNPSLVRVGADMLIMPLPLSRTYCVFHRMAPLISVDYWDESMSNYMLHFFDQGE